MKYLLKAIKNTKAWMMMLVDVVFTIIYLAINAKVLMWISAATSAANNEEAMHFVNLIIVGCAVNTVLGFISSMCKVSKHMLFTYISNALADKVLDADVAMFDKHSPAAISHAGGNIWKISGIPDLALRNVRFIIAIVVNLVAIISLVPVHILVLILVVFVIATILTIIVNSVWNKIDAKTDTIIKKRNAELDEITNGFIEARSFADTVETHRSSIYNYNSQIMRTIIKRNGISSSLDVVLEVATSVAFIIALLYVVATDSISSAVGVALVMYIWRLSEPMISLIFGLSDFSDMKSALPKIEEIMEYENSMVNGDIKLTSFDSEIVLRNVSFAYNTSDLVLDDISMTIPKGSNIGICGPSGGGKSTLLKLIPRFYDVSEGSIEIDGINIKELTKSSMMSHIGIVHQNIYIFDGTIKDNICYGRKQHNVQESEIIEACKKANIWDFICSLPDGLYTEVGPRGLKLSGGQKQRISIARVFLTNPDIILMDEATAALDNESEKVVQESLKLFKGKTIITVAHRLSTIKECDTIYVIDSHRIVEAGTHKQLMNLKGKYYELANK